MTTVTCRCGRRLRLERIPPGKSGRCPICGESVQVPEVPVAAPMEEDEWNWEGSYGVAPQFSQEVVPPQDTEWKWEGVYEVTDAPPPPIVVKPPAPPPKEPEPIAPEPWFPPRLLYPGRGVEGVAIASAIGGMLWLMGTLVPEYCIGLMADAEGLGALPMGHLVSIVTAMPVLLLAPLVATYWLQYLGRVLVSSAEGERNPPRPPDRNVDGVLGGMASWVIWVALGLSVGMLPLAMGGLGTAWNPERTIGLGLAGLPYALMALLLTFLHDDDFAASPWRVIGGLLRVGPSFLILSLVVAATLGAGAMAFVGVLRLREGYFSLYIALSLGCWILLVWLTLVAMQTLGSYFYARKDRMKWRRARPWWEVG
ncbi:hypothetical protein P12x_000035 [Tundrisphaera lichenicola]|uniref:hypothetical protein n=1 Tax=Tundrisphaera lichenicola TaxID=2029860 RepID=UPI003EB80A16